MRINKITIVTYSVLGVAAAGAFLLPDSLPSSNAAPMQVPPAQLRLSGLVRDFRAAHVDFDVAYSYGHTADLLSHALDDEGRPIFNAGSDENGPLDNRVGHWRFDEGSGLMASDEQEKNHGHLVSGPTWTTGHSGAAIHFDGVNDYVNVPSSPEMQIKGDVTFAGWFKLDADFNAASPRTMVIMEKFLDTEHDFHIGLAGVDYNRAEVPKGRLVFKVENGPTSDYYCYVWTNQDTWNAGEWYQFACSLSSGNTASNRIFINGVDDTASAIAAGVGFLDTDYDAPMRIGGKTIDYNGKATDVHFEGTIDDIIVFDRTLASGDWTTKSPGGYVVSSQWRDAGGNNIAPHTYTDSGAGITDACGSLIADVAGVRGVASNGEISSTASFDQWFADSLGTNMSAIRSITLTQNVDGIYEYANYAFYPIDGKLYGNEDLAHNNFFTYTFGTSFTYETCGGQFIELEGGDGTWLFVDDRLAIDLGGVLSSTMQRIDLDRFELQDGNEYIIRFFYSQRSSTESVLRLRTNIELAASIQQVVTGSFD